MTWMDWLKRIKGKAGTPRQWLVGTIQVFLRFNQIPKPIFAAGMIAGVGLALILDSRLDIRRTFHKNLHVLISAKSPVMDPNWYSALSTGKQTSSASEAVRSVTRLFDDLLGAGTSGEQVRDGALSRLVSITEKDERGRGDKGAAAIQVVAVVTYEDFSRLLGRLERHDLTIEGMSLLPYGQGDEGRIFHRATFDLRVRAAAQLPAPQGVETTKVQANPFHSAFFDPLEVGGDNKYVPHTAESGFINNMLVKPGAHVRLNDRAKGRYVEVIVVEMLGDEARLQSEKGDRTYRIPASGRKD